MPASSRNHTPTPCMTSSMHTFAPTSRFGPPDLDPIFVVHPPAVDRHEQRRTLISCLTRLLMKAVSILPICREVLCTILLTFSNHTSVSVDSHTPK